VVTYEYDSASRLIQRVEGGTTTNLHWHDWDLIKEVKTGSISETTNYLVPFGEVLAFERGGDWFYLHSDGLSSTQLITDENGDQVGRFINAAWGEELYASETIPGLFENRFVGGLGCRKDAATGLIYMRHRWYDCALMRFISRDPIGLAGGTNLYVYPNPPTDLTDASGLVPCGPTPMHHDWANHTHWNNDPADAPLRVAARTPRPNPKPEDPVNEDDGGGGSPRRRNPVKNPKNPFNNPARPNPFNNPARPRPPGLPVVRSHVEAVRSFRLLRGDHQAFMWLMQKLQGPWNQENSIYRVPDGEFKSFHFGAVMGALGWTVEEAQGYGGYYDLEAIEAGWIFAVTKCP
jgi:RHS repeat-associated protein